MIRPIKPRGCLTLFSVKADACNNPGDFLLPWIQIKKNSFVTLRTTILLSRMGLFISSSRLVVSQWLKTWSYLPKVIWSVLMRPAYFRLIGDVEHVLIFKALFRGFQHGVGERVSLRGALIIIPRRRVPRNMTSKSQCERSGETNREKRIEGESKPVV